MLRAVVMIGSLAILGGAGYAAWTGVGGATAASAAAARGATAAGSLRAGSPGTRGTGAIRVK